VQACESELAIVFHYFSLDCIVTRDICSCVVRSNGVQSIRLEPVQAGILLLYMLSDTHAIALLLT
jgi:hypothetical protein